MVYYNILSSPIGNIVIYVKGDKLYAIHFEKNIYYKAIEDVSKTAFFTTQLKEYFTGQRNSFSLPFWMQEGTPFQHKVWNELLKIPYGTTASYQDIAQKIGHSSACRAVGMANHCNRIPIVIPCHRVIAKNGKLTGYAGGLDKKEFLLNLEQKYK